MGLRESLLSLVSQLGGKYSREEEVAKIAKLTDHRDESADLLERLNANMSDEDWLELERRRMEAFRSLRGVMSSTQRTPRPQDTNAQPSQDKRKSIWKKLGL